MQLRLPLSLDDRTAETFIVSQANAAAWAALEDWRSWPGGAMTLTGPVGAGKTHAARAWAAGAQAQALIPGFDLAAAQAGFAASGGRLWVDDAESGLDDEATTWLIDQTRSEGGALLLVGAGQPRTWAVRTIDLRSRLSAAPSAQINEPDLQLLEGVLRRLARAQILELSAPAARYLAARIERSFAAARAVVELLADAVRDPRTPISIEIARRALARYDDIQSTIDVDEEAGA